MVKIWNYETGRFYYNLTGVDNTIYCIAWSPDGKKIAAGRSDGILTVWDVDSQQIDINTSSAASTLYSIDWSPDGKQIVGGSSDSKMRIWDVNSGQIKKTMVMHTQSINSVSWSRDGKYIASGSADETARIWNGTTGADICTLSGHTKSVSWVAFSPDSKILASGSGDGSVILYEKDYIDLKIRSFFLAKAKIGENGQCRITITVSNEGNVPAMNQTIELYDDDVSIGRISFDILNRSQKTLTYDYYPPVSEPDGSHRISAEINGVQASQNLDIQRSTIPSVFGVNGLFLIMFIVAVVIVGIILFVYKRRSGHKTTVILTDYKSSSSQNALHQTANLSRTQPGSAAVPGKAPTTGQTNTMLQASRPIAGPPVQHPAPQPAVAPSTANRNVELKSALDFISGFLVIKIAVLNQSQYSLTRCSLSIDYNRKVFALDRVQPQTYEKDRSGDKVSIGEILPGDRRTTVEFYLDPYICTGGEVSAIFSYHDHLGQPHDIRLQPKKVDVLCPVLTAKTIDPSQLNSPSMWAIFDRLAHKNARAVNVTGMPMELAFELACEVVERRDVRRVRKGLKPEGLVAWYYGKTPRMEGTGQEWDFLINVWRKPECNAVEFMVAADSQGAITGLLSKLGEEFGEAVERKGLPRPVTKVINITDCLVYKGSLDCG